MPYWITDQQPDCDGWAVVKEDDGELETVACQQTKQDAIDNAVAIALAEGDGHEFMGERDQRAVYTPPQGVRDAARRALGWIAEGKAGDGFTDVGRRRASQLANGEPVSDTTVARMKSYFARHAVDKQATGFNRGEDGYPTPGRVAWDAWGGDAGESWVNGLNLDENRGVNDPDAVILDIDDTLIVNGRLSEAVYDYANSLGGAKLVVTGRPESDRDDTVAELENLGVVYTQLFMNDGSTADSTEYKKETAVKLLESWNILEAIENNPDARAAYESLGIKATNPAELRGGKSRSVEEQRALDRADKILAAIRKKSGVKPEPETRVNHVDFEIRADAVSGDKLTFSGYAAVFDSPSEDLGGFTETIAPGAFKRTLAARNDVKLLWNHDMGEPLASTRSGTLRLFEDATGLRVEADIAPTTRGKDLSILMQQGIVHQMSFGFNVMRDSWADGGSKRRIESVRLFEVSVVTAPAYTATSAAVRSLNKSVSADELANALLALEAGVELDPDKANAIREVVAKLEATPEVQEVNGDILALKKTKLDLMMKGLM